MNDTELFATLNTCVDGIADAIVAYRGQGYSGLRDTQYHLDLAADAVALKVLGDAGFRVVSEESGVTGESAWTVVVDPIDGSTNCDKGVPFFASSLAVLQNGELYAALVANLATGTRFQAVRGGGATRDGEPISPSGTTDLSHAIVAYSGYPTKYIGWSQFRVLGAASLECCLVADGSLDVFTTANKSTLRSWDYLGGLLVAHEAGAVTAEWDDLNLVIDSDEPRRPIFAASAELLSTIQEIGEI